ncbi:hypothetical protein SAY87_015352 [Trapa incisa]|uniref:Flavin mononucleotide hydrolase 1, chloroplatic n=1 Tax=Trapa incisa TaxID=236973 RepID=A0AAN7GLJ0_9MYRT|nr:hypothetical protein SAY87_015352 [Trapa incisa]
MAVLMGPLPRAVQFAFPATPPRLRSTASTASAIRKIASLVSSSPNMATEGGRKFPVLLFDIMDTIVRDPFYEDVPAFFGMCLRELIECKHPTAWIEFEKGVIDEVELSKKFFKDRRPFDLEGLKACMINGFSYLDGVEELLHELRENNYEMHASTNYPIWYQMIEDKLQISKFLSWTFCSCTLGKRKPEPDFYSDIVVHLGVDPGNCIFIDDRLKNVEAAAELGIVSLQFKSADKLRRDFSNLGIDIQTRDQLMVEETSS